MYNQWDYFITRKVFSTFVATAITSIVMSLIWITDSWFESPYNRGHDFLGWALIYFMYVGLIMLVFGNLVSISVEYIQNKWFVHNDWLYILLHASFGLANGIWLQSGMFAVAGMGAAVLYAVIDRWIYKRLEEDKGTISFIYVPILLYGLLWGALQITSSPLPPFTKEAAVEFATSGEGTDIDYFPKRIGMWSGVIDGFQVERETTAKEIGREEYIVSFTETWRKGKVSGSCVQSYKVERQSSALFEMKGGTPPYYYNP